MFVIVLWRPSFGRDLTAAFGQHVTCCAGSIRRYGSNGSVPIGAGFAKVFAVCVIMLDLVAAPLTN